MPKFWELAPSPNNVKVRLALAYKGIPFETVEVDYADRSPVQDVSGQELTPVIEDRGIVLNDSEAILQYLDANYPDAPRLYPRHRDGRRACDAWERKLQQEVAQHWAPVFFHAVRMRDDLDAEALARYKAALAALDAQLGDADSFHGPDMAVCDLRVAIWAGYALPSPAMMDRTPAFALTRKTFAVEEGSLPNLERFLVPWNERNA